METSKPPTTDDPEKILRDKILEDLKKEYKKILINNLDEREYKDDKIKLWVNNIIIEAKNYFINKYDGYDIFLFCLVSEKGLYFRQIASNVGITKSDKSDFVDFETNTLYVLLNFFFFKHYNLDYSLEGSECDIIRKGNEILSKNLENRKYVLEKIKQYNSDINNEHIKYILEKVNKLRCFSLNRIFQNPIKRYYYNYLIHGKQIYSKIFQTYSNDSLTCCHEVFFFK